MSTSAGAFVNSLARVIHHESPLLDSQQVARTVEPQSPDLDMAEYFDPSPRSSKRRKTDTYGATRSTLSEESGKRPSVLRTVSETFSGLSRRLFENKKPKQVAPANDDSTYGSKEDSLVEEEGGEAESHLVADDVEAEEGGEPIISANSSRGLQRTPFNPRNDGDTMSVAEGSSRNTRSHKAADVVDGSKKDRKITLKDPSPIHSPAKRGFGSARRTSQKQQFIVKKPPQTSPARPSNPRKRSANLAEPEAKSPPEQTAEKDEDTVSIQPRSSGRERRAPRRYSIDIERPEDLNSPQPKGILTPSRKGKKTPRKSVAFDEQEKRVEEDLGFRDIDPVTKKSEAPTAESGSGGQLGGETEAIENPETPLDEEEAQVAELREAAPETELFSDVPCATDWTEALISVDEPVDEAVDEELPDDAHITSIKSTILARITSRLQSKSDLLHLQSQHNTLHTLLAATVTSGESNSLLLLGSRGSGKSLLVQRALADLTQDYQDDFHVVRLNGFVQTDDKLALREIWRQLGREMQVAEDETNEVNSYADTMASLLALLAHPEELLDPNVMDLDGTADGRTAKSVIFILDEFDLFTTHPRQTLLYNLFDIAQSRKAPIAVIGCSARMDVVDCLEKRVKSRFSHRWVYVPSVKSLVGWEEVVDATLCIGEQTQSNRAKLVRKIDSAKQREWEQSWDEHIKNSFLPSQSIQTLLKQTFYTTKSLPDLFAALYIPIATLSVSSESCAPAQNRSLTASISSIASPSSILALLPSLPVVHLTLLTCATRLESIHTLSTLNFNITYAHYRELCARAKLQQGAAGIRVWSREVARGAWEELSVWEVLVPVESSGNMGIGGKEGGVGGETRMCRVDVGIEDVSWAIVRKQNDGGGVGGMAEILGKWCREI